MVTWYFSVVVQIQLRAEVQREKLRKSSGTDYKSVADTRRCLENGTKIGMTEIEALQFHVRAISIQIQGTTSDRDRFLIVKNKLRMQLNECSQKIHALRESLSGILGQISNTEIADLERNTPKGFEGCDAAHGVSKNFIRVADKSCKSARLCDVSVSDVA